MIQEKPTNPLPFPKIKRRHILTFLLLRGKCIFGSLTFRGGNLKLRTHLLKTFLAFLMIIIFKILLICSGYSLKSVTVMTREWLTFFFNISSIDWTIYPITKLLILFQSFFSSSFCFLNFESMLKFLSKHVIMPPR